MPEFRDIVLYVLFALVVFLTVAAILLLLRRGKDPGNAADFQKLEKQLGEGFASQGKALMTTIYESLLSFNEKVNLKLSDNADKAAGNIADFRVNVNHELTEFQEKINARVVAEFRTMAEVVEKQMGAINAKVEERLKQGFVDTNETFGRIATRIQMIDEAQKNIQDLSRQMISLEDILSNNQSRGRFGEFQLEKVLFSVFGDNKGLYELQYTIREQKGKSETVRADAVVHLPGPEGLVAVDSKFPFKNYERLFGSEPPEGDERIRIVQEFGADVKKHITAIAGKYIISGKTINQALMFVPTDGILTLLHSELRNVIEYAQEKHVTIVSPTTLVPLLSSFYAFMIDYQRSLYATQLKKDLDVLTKEFGRFAEDWGKLNGSIERLGRQSSDVNLRVGKITTRFDQIRKVDFPDDEPDAIDTQDASTESDNG